MSDEEFFRMASSELAKLHLSFEDYAQVKKSLSEAMALGLDPKTKKSSSLKMYESFVHKLPRGHEKGRYLALDLGGTNFRILVVTLTGGEEILIEEESYAIPKDIMTGTGQKLFNFIAKSLYEFLRGPKYANQEFELGFTFSFPCEQISLESAKLVKWTKGFTASGVQGEDVVALLQEEINKLGLKVKCVAIINDTVGTLASCALSDPLSAIGLIVGTGTNAAYIEAGSDGKKNMVINTEWGAFGENGELENFRTQYDRKVDEQSIRPGAHIFEKMVSGMYLGEIVRHILIDLTSKKILFGGKLPEKLRQENGFPTKILSEVERDPPGVFMNSQSVLSAEYGVENPSEIDGRIVRLACELVSKRAAYLIGTGIAALVQRMQRPRVTLGVDGSVFRYHTRFGENMIYMFHKFNSDRVLLRVMVSSDGSGKGAAAIAAAAMH